MDRLTVLERGAPNSLCLIESGKILPDVKVAIVHPDSKVPCAHTDLGEVMGNMHMHDEKVLYISVHVCILLDTELLHVVL